MSRCWECEKSTSRPQTVVLPTTAAHLLRVTLCPSCYRAYYLPLMSQNRPSRRELLAGGLSMLATV